MDAYAGEWLQLLIRWVHLITGIAWIGASFYFVWLDNSLRPPALARDADEGVGGELWAIHGGGFYHVQKFRVAPAELPPLLHWFKWEAYSTWLSGFALLVVLYWWHADIYIVDRSVSSITPLQAVLVSAALLVAGWLVYDQLCKRLGFAHERVLAVVLVAMLTAVAWGLSHVFSGRAMYMQIGAMLGTLMAANVLLRHHSVAAQARRSEGARRGAGSGLRDARQAAVGAQQLFHAARAADDDQQSLSDDVRASARVARAHVPVAARRLRSPFLQPAPSRSHRVGDSADGRGGRARAGGGDRAGEARCGRCRRAARRAADHRRALRDVPRRASALRGPRVAAEGRRAGDGRRRSSRTRRRSASKPSRRGRCRSATSRR